MPSPLWLLVPTLISIAEVRRPLFIAGSVTGLLLTCGLTIWYVKAHDAMRAIASVGGAVIVASVAWLGAPSSEDVPEPPESPSIPTPSFDDPDDEIVAEEPSESDSLFNGAIRETTPWYNQIKNLYSAATVEDEGEAALLATWWALADWCVRTKNGSEGRCYDPAALYVREAFTRDPRTINAETWYGGWGHPFGCGRRV
jgi:hypothetical protein